MRRTVAVGSLVVGLFVGLVATSAPVGAQTEPEGSSGSTFENGQVTCGTRNTFLDSPITLHNNGHGLEVCSDELPIQGRVFLYHTPGSGPLHIDFLHADGDADNPAPLPQGHILHIPIGLP